MGGSNQGMTCPAGSRALETFAAAGRGCDREQPPPSPARWQKRSGPAAPGALTRRCGTYPPAGARCGRRRSSVYRGIAAQLTAAGP